MPVVSVRSFAPLMRQTVLIQRMSSYGDYGERVWTTSTGETYRAAVYGEMKKVRLSNGEEVPSRVTAVLQSNAAIRPEDRIVLSTEDVGSTESFAISPEILAVERYPFGGYGQFVTILRMK